MFIQAKREAPSLVHEFFARAFVRLQVSSFSYSILPPHVVPHHEIGYSGSPYL